MKIRDFLKTQKLLADGAFGTYYVQLTGDGSKLAELSNITDPELVKRIHTDYIEAGARLLRSNTFAANRAMLGSTKKEQGEIIRAGYRLARQAADQAEEQVFPAADIGPIPEGIKKEPEQLIEEYQYICDQFLAEGAELFVFETFADFKYLDEIVKYVKSKKDVFVITQFSLNRYGYTKSGMSATSILAAADKNKEIDGVGFNCGIGSGHLYQILKKQALPEDKIFTAFPNSGYPEQHQDRTVYIENHQYFAERLNLIASLGIHILGGCCGTTPDYIEASGSMLDYAPVKKDTRNASKGQTIKKEVTCKNNFYRKMMEGKKVIAVELDPPYDAKDGRIMECANILKASGTDIITFADSPMGRGRVDSILMAVKVWHEVGVPIMPHIACRDKNAIALRAGLLGGYLNEIRNLLIVTGDPIPKGDIKSVFDFNSIQLMEFVSQLNKEHFPDEPIYFGGALNPGRVNIDNEIKRMEKKIQAGASYFLTQPIFSEEGVERISYIKQKVETKILCGIMPLISYRNAAFIRNEITGIQVPDHVMEQYHPDMSREEGEETGARIAGSMMKQLAAVADGYYFMLPFNRVHMVEKCLNEMKK